MTRVFLSYARGDDEQFVRRLYDDLVKAGFTVWFDRESLMSRGTTFHQEIKDAIRTEVDRVVYVGGPKAAQSAYVREEWRSALEYDHVVVTPILRLGEFATSLPGELSLMHCEDFREDSRYPAAIEKLIRSLREPNPKLGALCGVPNLPPNFIGRPELMNRVRDALLVDLQKPQVITSADARVGIQGMGGIGKSVLAAALVRNRDIRRSYPDGVVWVSFGQKLTDGDLLQRQRDVVRHLGGDAGFESLVQGQGVLRELLQAKAVLLVLDDLWGAKDAQPFDLAGPRCRMLVTTRDAGILHALHGELLPVSLFSEVESLQLLADTVGVPVADLAPAAREVAGQCGNLPLALVLSGGMAMKRGGDFASVLERLRRADLEKIADRESINPQHRDIWRAMQASVEMLDADRQRRFAELSVFFTDRMIPEAAIGVLWAHTGGLDDLDTEELLVELVERSLVQCDTQPGKGNKPRRRFRLHDLLYDYTTRIAGDRNALHQRLLDAYRAKCPGGWHAGPNDEYFFENLASHLAVTHAWAEAEALVTDFPWLMRKCELGLLDSIASDYALFMQGAPAEAKGRLEIWSDFFREKAHMLRRRNDEWLAHKILLQLAVEHADDSPLTIASEKWLAENRCDWLWLRRTPRLAHARRNPCLFVLEGHTGEVTGAAALANERLLSWSGGKGFSDNTLRMWDRLRGNCLAVMNGHRSTVNGAMVLPNERLLSWSDDSTLRLWDSSSGASLAVMEGHTSRVNGALTIGEEKVLSWSADKTLRLWDISTGAVLLTMKGHAGWIRGAFKLGKERLVSWSDDKTLRIWDIQSGACLAVLEGHANSLGGAVPIGDGSILSWAGFELRIWDSRSYQCVNALQGHSTGVEGALILDEKRILSWSGEGEWDNGMMRAWGIDDGACLASVQFPREAGIKGFHGALKLADGCVLTWSGTRLEVWERNTLERLATFDGHTDEVEGALELSGGHIVSWAGKLEDHYSGELRLDKAIRVWHRGNGMCVGILEGHTDEVFGVLSLADGHVVSWSKDRTLRIWDCNQAVPVTANVWHTTWASGALPVMRDRVVTHASWPDCTLRVWDIYMGNCVGTLAGHTSSVVGALALSDCRLLTWSLDNRLRVWNCLTVSCLAVLEGHTSWVKGALALKDGRLVSWAGDYYDTTLRVWDSRTFTCLAVLKGHTTPIGGAVELSNGYLLSWSSGVLRLWDTSNYVCLSVLNAYADNAMLLGDGRVLSWSGREGFKHVLQLWDMVAGTCEANLVGHTGGIDCVCELTSSRLLSWAVWPDKTVRCWDSRTGACLEVVPEDRVGEFHPEWLRLRRASDDSATVSCGSSLDDSPRSYFTWRTSQHEAVVFLRRLADAGAAVRTLYPCNSNPLVACWNAVQSVHASRLLSDGTAIVTQADGQVCILKLHKGNRRISLAEAEALVASQMKMEVRP